MARSLDVLVVDDDEDIRSIAKLALGTLAGWSVRAVASAGEALAAARERRPDVVLLDAVLPDMDGPAAAARLRTEAGATVVFLTARAQPDDLREYRAAGAAGVIAKPFDPVGLAGQVQRLVDAGAGRTRR